MTTPLKNQTALITGATSGIGYELAKLFVENGYNVVAVARNEDDLQRVAREFGAYGVPVETIATDLFGDGAATALYEEIKRRNIVVDVLVNDAGQGRFGLFAELELDHQIEIIRLNVISLTKLTYHVLKDMLARNQGKILNVASMLAEWPSPYNAVYAATKAYVKSLTEALISEVKESAVTLTVLEPPATNTNFWPVSDSLPSKSFSADKLADPAMVAKAGYDALMSGTDKVVPGLGNKAFMAATKLMPDTVVADMLKDQSKPADADK